MSLVQSGMPFREAYIKVKSNKDTNQPLKPLKEKFISGSAYNLDLKILKSRLQKLTSLNNSFLLFFFLYENI